MTSTLTVSEVFGPVHQGEGPSAGELVTFVRLGLCNLHCVWCDTAYTWRFNDSFPHNEDVVYDRDTELRTMTVHEIDNHPDVIAARRLVISGGEPMLQLQSINELITRFSNRTVKLSEYGPRYVEIETAGTIMPTGLDQYNIRFNVSPKLSNSGNDRRLRIKENVLKAYAYDERARFKFVVKTESDLDEVLTLKHLIGIPAYKIWIMPEGRTPEDIAFTGAEIYNKVINYGWNMSLRNHVILFGDKRGV